MEHDQQAAAKPLSPLAIISFWQLVVGSIFTGLSVFSLYVRLRQVGLYGVVNSVHEQYEWLRDTVFAPVQAIFPFLRMTPSLKTFLLLMLIFVALALRTAFMVRRSVGGSMADNATAVFIFFFLGAIAFLTIFACGLFFWSNWAEFYNLDIGASLAIAAFVLGPLLMCAPFIGLARDPETRLIIQLGAANAAACVFWTVALLALNAASMPG